MPKFHHLAIVVIDIPAGYWLMERTPYSNSKNPGCIRLSIEGLRHSREALRGKHLLYFFVQLDNLLERFSDQLPNVTTQAWTADYPDPDNFLRIAAIEAIAAWGHPRYDELVKSARRSIDQEERMSTYAEAQRLLIEEAPYSR